MIMNNLSKIEASLVEDMIRIKQKNIYSELNQFEIAEINLKTAMIFIENNEDINKSERHSLIELLQASLESIEIL